MMKAISALVEKWFRIPPEPEAPPGDEHTARVFRAAPNYYKYRLAVFFIGRVIMLLFFLIFAGGMIFALLQALPEKLMWIPVVVVIVFLFLTIVSSLLSFVSLRLDYEKRWYLVTDRSLRIRQGVKDVREMTINFANIQNISVTQGPLQRKLGISDLKVETAGGSSGGHQGKHPSMLNLHTAYFTGVDNAEEIRDLIQSRLRLLKDAGLGDQDDAPDAVAGGRAVGLTRTDPAVLETMREVLSEAKRFRQAAQSRS